ncbi:hypothetical protein [Kiloniella sp. b19]|uniref:hypothetical protein n=1 Tax=Kiloniella sp. GXU_MW_B19 TaxID=3141326 RepID=UPI0031D568A8
MRRFLILLASITAAALSSAGQSAQAQSTPNHVFQTVETLNLQLEEILKANFLSVPSDRPLTREARRPRHVFQKARTVFSTLQTYKRLNGLQVSALPDIPGRDLTPADVHGLVTRIHSGTEELAKRFAAPVVPQSELPSGKSPRDVYQELERSMVLLGSLDVPKQQPNDVYQTASTIVNVLEEIAKSRGVEGYPRQTEKMPGKKPGDVYNLAGSMLDYLKIGNPLFEVPAGAAAYDNSPERVTPKEVNDIIGLLLADLAVIKRNVGLTSETPYAELEGGKNPSDVFERINTSYMILMMIDQ